MTRSIETGSGSISARAEIPTEQADKPVLADGRDMSGETVMGMRVAAYRHPASCPPDLDKDAWLKFFRGSPPSVYAEHWSTPGSHRTDVERLFTEADVRAAIDKASTASSAGRSEATASKPSDPLIGELVEALRVIANASERSETMFGGKMSDVTRVFQHITRVSRAALAKYATQQGSREPFDWLIDQHIGWLRTRADCLTEQNEPGDAQNAVHFRRVADAIQALAAAQQPPVSTETADGHQSGKADQ